MRYLSLLRAAWLLMLIMGLVGCTQQLPMGRNKPLSDDFKDYWYQGLAELTSFDLEQVRYGEVRQGLATTIFVTEDFRQVSVR